MTGSTTELHGEVYREERTREFWKPPPLRLARNAPPDGRVSKLAGRNRYALNATASRDLEAHAHLAPQARICAALILEAVLHGALLATQDTKHVALVRLFGQARRPRRPRWGLRRRWERLLYVLRRSPLALRRRCARAFGSRPPLHRSRGGGLFNHPSVHHRLRSGVENLRLSDISGHRGSARVERLCHCELRWRRRRRRRGTGAPSEERPARPPEEQDQGGDGRGERTAARASS